jgi:hypothetical protein
MNVQKKMIVMQRLSVKTGQDTTIAVVRWVSGEME